LAGKVKPDGAGCPAVRPGYSPPLARSRRQEPTTMTPRFAPALAPALVPWR